MMTEDHVFFVDGEQPTVGRAAMEKAWRGYFDAFPAYRILRTTTSNAVALFS